ncbi:MAG: alpha-amylase family glycosyl hydrolase [Nonlabens sp.]
MKKQICFLLAVFVLAFAKAQNPHTSMIPATANQNDQVVLQFDATGTVFENTTQTLYAHTGVTFDGAQWSNVKAAWATTGTDIRFTNTSNNIYELDLGMSINDYYNITSGTITHITMVVRNADGSEQIRPDEYIPVFAPGLNVAITNPRNGEIFANGETITVSADCSATAALELTVNGSSIGSSNASNISASYTFNSTGNFTISATADNGGNTASDNINVYVPGTTQNIVQPAGLKNGVNENADGSVTFLLSAPLKNDVMLIGSFTGWELLTQYQMNKDGDDFWITVPPSEFTANTDFMYQYLIDFDIKVADPYSELILDPGSDQFIKPGNYPNLPQYPLSETTGDVTVYTYQKTPYNWTTNNFQRPDKENLVVYEILARDFSEEDSFQAIIDRIDYLDDLNINVLQFMPVNEFEGTDSWGYNPKFHGALDKAYGTPEKFKELVDLCHSRGIAVVIDVVYNHAFSQSPLCQMWWDDANFRPAQNNPYMNVTPTHDFNVGYDMNHESQLSRDYVKQTLQYFIDEYRVDGFRFDLSKGFTQNNTLGNIGAWNAYDQSRVDILNDYKNTIWNANGNDIYMILEHLGGVNEEAALANQGFMLWGKMTEQFNENSMGQNGDTNVFRSYFTSRNFNEQHLVAYAESHDEERLMVNNLQFGNTSNSNHNVRTIDVALDRQEAIAAILYSIPGPKMLWQFGELGYDVSINASATNLNCTTCRTDRKPIPWSRGYQNDPDRMRLYRVTANMIRLKTEFPETFNSTNNFLDVDTKLKRINLYGPNFDAVVIANFEVGARGINPSFSRTGTWYDYTNNNAPRAINSSNQNAAIGLAPGEYRVFTSQPLNRPLSNGIDADLADQDVISLYPNPATTQFELSDREVDTVKIFNISGQRVKYFEGTKDSYGISDLPSGVYLVKVEKNDQSVTKKLIIQ